MDGKTSGVSIVSRHNLCKFNHPQKIPKTKNGKLILEDGLWCDYNCSYTKLKMWELAYKLKDIAKKLDYASLNIKRDTGVSEQVVQIIFENVNIVTFQRDEKRFVDIRRKAHQSAPSILQGQYRQVCIQWARPLSYCIEHDGSHSSSLVQRIRH